METLVDALTQYANETLIPRFERETAGRTRAIWHKVDELTEQLEALGPDAERWMGELKKELLNIDVNHERATLLAGISIGLELGRL